MNTQLATLADNAVELNKAFGFGNERAKPSIPVLRINATSDDDKPSAPKGTFVYDDGERILHAPDVIIRTFLKCVQYRLWHDSDKTKNDMSIIAPSFKAEFKSISGKLAC